MKKPEITFHLISVFPDIFTSYFKESLFKRALLKNLINIQTYDLRDFTSDERRTVDGRPFGGGPGMVLQVEPIYKAVSKIKNTIRRKKNKRTRVILFSTRGRTFDASVARRLARYDHLILICGRYEGVDERISEHIADEEISIGDYVLSGGEIPAMAVVEATSRFIPGFLGKQESLEEIKGSYPVYTRPERFSYKKKGNVRKTYLNVPKVLLSGDHKKIEEWRKDHSSRV